MDRYIMTVEDVMGSNGSHSLMLELTHSEFEAFNAVRNEFESGTNKWMFSVRKVDDEAASALYVMANNFQKKMANDIFMPFGSLAVMKRMAG